MSWHCMSWHCSKHLFFFKNTLNSEIRWLLWLLWRSETGFEIRPCLRIRNSRPNLRLFNLSSRGIRSNCMTSTWEESCRALGCGSKEPWIRTLFNIFFWNAVWHWSRMRRRREWRIIAVFFAILRWKETVHIVIPIIRRDLQSVWTRIS